MKPKYEFTGESKTTVDGIKVSRIRRLSDGLVGGWIEKSSNLSHEGNCFVYGNGRVDGNAVVDGDAWVSENAWVFGYAQVYGAARVTGNARVDGEVVTPEENTLPKELNNLPESITEVVIGGETFVKTTVVRWIKK